ncbi:MAG: hypothetical protein KDC87_09765 [Planctomycetes bacterium]|nr:hypothetical protein [Planctomycetota bacterium]
MALLAQAARLSRLTDPSRRAASPASISLPMLLAVSFAARVPAILWSRGYTFFDEQFQYLDPAHHLATGAPFLQTHEWVSGIRSWVFPGIVAGFLRVARWLGVEGPENELCVVRLCLGLFSLLAVYGVFELVRAARLAQYRTAVLLLGANNGILVYQGVHPNGAAFSCGLVVFGLGLVAAPGKVRALVAGLAVGLAACCRPQDGLFAASICVMGIATRRFRDIGAFAAGSLTMVLVQGLVDVHTWGGFLHSGIEYVRFNLAHSSDWGGQSPFTYLMVVLLLAPLAHTGLRLTFASGMRLPWVAFAVLVSLLAHQVLDRRAPRFVTPSLALIILFWAIGIAIVWPARTARARGLAGSLGLAALLQVGLFCAASLGYANRHRIETVLYLESARATGIAYCGLSPIDSGGAFYHRSRAHRTYIDAAELPSLLACDPRISHVVARAHTPIPLPPRWRLAREAVFDAVWDPHHRQTYVVYRVRVAHPGRTEHPPRSGRPSSKAWTVADAPPTWRAASGEARPKPAGYSSASTSSCGASCASRTLLSTSSKIALLPPSPIR